MRIVRTRGFAKSIKRLAASEEDLRELEANLAKNPEAGDVIKGSGGARKARFAMAGKGKSGGGRAIYVAVRKADTIFLLLAYAKSQQEDLSPEDLKVLKPLVKELKDAQTD